MNRILSVRWIIYAVTAMFMLGGCSLFHHRDNYYAKAQETRPLEVPPDMDSPPTSDELIVPQVGNNVGRTDSSAARRSAVVDTAPGATMEGRSLRVADSVDNTWRRVGTALEQANVGAVSGRDESAHSYTLEVDDLRTSAANAESPQERHWYTAIWHRIQHPLGGKKTVSGKLLVTVTADGDGSRVNVQGPSGVDSSDATQRVLQALRTDLSSSAASEATPATAAGATLSSAVSVGEGLHLADTVDHAWQRVGLALERGDLGKISARDETNHSYSLDVEGLTVKTVQRAEQPKQEHWYSAIVDRILYPTGHHDKVEESKPVSGKVQVKVVSDGDGSRVEVDSAPGTDSSEAARRVLQVLQTRLG